MSSALLELCCGFSLCFTEWGGAHQFPHSGQTQIAHCRIVWCLVLLYWLMKEINFVFLTPTGTKINVCVPHCSFWIESESLVYDGWQILLVSLYTNKAHRPILNKSQTDTRCPNRIQQLTFWDNLICNIPVNTWHKQGPLKGLVHPKMKMIFFLISFKPSVYV